MDDILHEILFQFDGFNKDIVFDNKNHKLYPFYYFTSFHTIKDVNVWPEPQKTERHEPMICSYCNKQLTTNSSGYYCANIVFEDNKTVKLCCSIKDCFKKHCYDFYDQIHGYPNPIELKEFKSSIDHNVIYKCVFGGSNVYAYNKYLKTGMKQEDIPNLGTGGWSSDINRSGFDGWVEYNNHEIQIKDKDFSLMKKYTLTDITRLVNEILEVNKPERAVQLKLF